MMKKQMTKYGIVFISLMAMVMLFGCSQNNKTQSSLPQTQPEAAGATNKSQESTAGSAVAEKELKVQKQLQFAEHYMASAKKGLASYAQSVAICRDVIKNNPGTPYETHARELLRQVPENQRDRLNITNEEMGL